MLGNVRQGHNVIIARSPSFSGSCSPAPAPEPSAMANACAAAPPLEAGTVQMWLSSPPPALQEPPPAVALPSTSVVALGPATAAAFGYTRTAKVAQSVKMRGSIAMRSLQQKSGQSSGGPVVLQQVLQEPAASQELTPRHAAPQGAAISLQQSGGLQ